MEIIISPSELDTMRQCPLRHQLLYGERWTKEIKDEGHPLAFGTLWHRILEQHYKVLMHFQKTALQQHQRWQAFDRVKARELARMEVNDVLAMVNDPEVAALLDWMYEGHIEQWGLDEDWQILAIEFGCEVALPGPIKTDFDFRIKMKLDLVVREAGRLVIVDNKSCKNLPHKLELDLDDQFGLYQWGMTQLEYKIFCTVHNAARKTRLKGDSEGTKIMPLTDRFKRTPLTRGKKELDAIAMEAWQDAYERYRSYYELLPLKRAGVVIEAQRHPQPSTCGWKCDFTEACIAGRKGVDLRDYLKRKGYKVDRSRH